MIVVRNTFIAKPGCASKLAAQLKDANVAARIPNARVMTDIVGGFNTVVLEHESRDLQEFEATMRQYETDQAFRERMKGYTDLYATGKREIFKIV